MIRLRSGTAIARDHRHEAWQGSDVARQIPAGEDREHAGPMHRSCCIDCAQTGMCVRRSKHNAVHRTGHLDIVDIGSGASQAAIGTQREAAVDVCLHPSSPEPPRQHEPAAPASSRRRSNTQICRLLCYLFLLWDFDRQPSQSGP